MSRRRKTMVALALAGLCGYGLWKAGDHLLGEDTAGASHFAQQLWIQRMPQDERDMIGYLVALRTDHGRFGAVGRASQWRQFTEVFRWALEGERLTTVFPQEGRRAQFRVKTWSCEGEAPRPFELCLKIGRGERSHTFYSREEWEVRPGHGVEDLLAEHPELAGVAAQLELEDLPTVEVEVEDAAPGWSPAALDVE